MRDHTITSLRKKSTRNHASARLPYKDAYAEASILRYGLIPAVEDAGFWKGCWGGYVAWDWPGERLFLDKPDRRAMRRLLMEGTWPGLVDLQKQVAREELDRKLCREEGRYWRGWSRGY